MITTPKKERFLQMLEHADCFENPKFGIMGTLKDNFDSLILSDLWPQEVPEGLIVNTEQQAILRARSIVHSFGIPHIKSGRFLDFGCGQGHCVIEAAKLGLESYGYDTKQHWTGTPEAGTLTTDKSTISAKAPFTIISVYDVIDHIMEQEDAIKAMRQVRAVSDKDTVIRVRCHPWTSRHGAHLYHSINKAFAHILLSDAELQKHMTDPVRKITRPLAEYKTIFEAAGLQIESMRKSETAIEPLFQTPELVEAFEKKLGHNQQWQQSVLPITFVDFVLKVP